MSAETSNFNQDERSLKCMVQIVKSDRLGMSFG